MRKKKRILSGIFCTIVGCSNNYNATEELSGELVNCGLKHYNYIMQSHVSINTCIQLHLAVTNTL